MEDKVGSRVHNLPLMPLLCGDNPISDVAPSKFLRLTDYQLFVLRQWAEGCFINEMEEGWLDPKTYPVFLPYAVIPPPQHRTGTGPGRFDQRLGRCFLPRR